MWWFKMALQKAERRLAPWVERRELAHRDAMASAHEASMVRGQRSVVTRLVFELGVHERDNHIVDMIHDVVKGARTK